MTTETPKSFDWSFRPFVLLGYATLAVLVLGLGGWGVFARISGAVIAMGTVEVEGNRQVVQHPIGGVVTEILARDGDVVAAGDVLLRLEGDTVRSEHAIVEGQLFELVARQDRLEAAARRARRDQLQRRDPCPRATPPPGARRADRGAGAAVPRPPRRAAARSRASSTSAPAQIENQIEGLEFQRTALARAGRPGRPGARGAGDPDDPGPDPAHPGARAPGATSPSSRAARAQAQASIAENRARIVEIDIEKLQARDPSNARRRSPSCARSSSARSSCARAATPSARRSPGSTCAPRSPASSTARPPRRCAAWCAPPSRSSTSCRRTST